ncbi:MAG: sulfatase-like hydrolase/transferase, partial [Muribaculaceae bacterium]|nr:sulfatase-like hydrolase/transferase [Muribaculaceae bacterium]
MVIQNILRFFKRLTISRGLVRLWLFLFILSVGSLSDVLNSAAYHDEAAFNFAGVSCVAVLKATALTAFYAFLRRNAWLKAVAVVLIVAFGLLSLLNGVCWLVYDFGITGKLFTLIVETNLDEVMEFLPDLTDRLKLLLQSGWMWISIVAVVTVWVLLPRVDSKWLALAATLLSVAGLVYMIYSCVSRDGGRASFSVFARSIKCSVAYLDNNRKIRELQAKKLPLPYLETLRSDRAAKRVVVVIGESASRRHLSFYGYPLPTTPLLDTVSHGLYRFDDAVASSTLTAHNIPRLISFMTDQPDSKEWYEFPSLLQIFRELGYKTYWLSNQEFSGKWSNLSSILSMDADVVKYVGAMDSEDYSLGRHDNALIPEWDNAWVTEDSLQLIFLHLMGSHFQYYNRFPEEQGVFSADDVLRVRNRRDWLDREKAQVVADYDNSIHYTDSILGVLMEDLRVYCRPALLIYVSDHGENIYDDRDYRGRDSKFVDVPFLVYANDAYFRDNPDVRKAIQDARKTPFSTSELPQMLLHMTSTDYKLYAPTRDPLSYAFKPRKRWVDGEIYYKD